MEGHLQALSVHILVVIRLTYVNIVLRNMKNLYMVLQLMNPPRILCVHCTVVYVHFVQTKSFHTVREFTKKS